jgi:membrane-associated protease RseP (regulator of RpoE activity)
LGFKWGYYWNNYRTVDTSLFSNSHELGHAFVQKANGVVVEEFGIGFPPRAWGKKLKNGTYFTLNWLTIGRVRKITR